MLTLFSQHAHPNCDGIGRRDFLKIGGLGLGGFGLPQLLAAREQSAKSGRSVKDTSVVWLWLGGGPTHVETFDPKMSAPVEYRSVTGEATTSIPGVTIGGQFEKVATQAEHFAFVRSFAHTNSGHGGGTHFLMTGYDNRMVDNGGQPSRPSLGSITAACAERTTKRPACRRTSDWTASEPMARRSSARPTHRSERTTKPRRTCRCERRSNESKIAARCSKALIRSSATRIEPD